MDKTKTTAKTAGVVSGVILMAVFGLANAEAKVCRRDIHDPRAIAYSREGDQLLTKGDFRRAKRNYSEAIRIDPTMWRAYYGRSNCFNREKKWANVVEDCNAGMRIKPDFLRFAAERGVAFIYRGEFALALADFGKVVACKPDTSLRIYVVNYRSWIEATCPAASLRNGPLAVADAMEACKLDGWKDARCIDTLAAANAEAGDFQAAVRY